MCIRDSLQDAILADAVLGAQLFPKLRADLVAALANLKGDHLARHRARRSFDSDAREEVDRATRSRGATSRRVPLAERSGLSSETARLVGIWSPPRGGETANARVCTANAGRDCLESDSDAAEEVARANRSLVRRAARFELWSGRGARHHSKQAKFESVNAHNLDRVSFGSRLVSSQNSALRARIAVSTNNLARPTSVKKSPPNIPRRVSA